MQVVGDQTLSSQAGLSGSSHPYAYYRRPGDPYRPAPARIKHTPSWDHARKFLLGDLRPFVPGMVPVSDGGFQSRYGDYLDRYNDMLWEGDELVDNLVKSFKDKSKGGRAAFQTALSEGIDAVENPSEELVALFEELDTEPEWLDWEVLERGQRILSNLPQFYWVLNSFLDSAFTAHSASVALATGATGRFKTHPENRMIEALTLFSSMSEPGGMRRFGAGFSTCVHVRLMHAFVRRAMYQKGDLFDFGSFGDPISNGDSVAAGPLFGVGVFLVMKGYGLKVKQDELEALDMLYRFMVHLMVGNKIAVAQNFEEGMCAIDYFFATLGEPSQFSEAMNRVFWQELKERMISNADGRGRKFLVKAAFDHILYPFLWDMLGDDLCEEIKYITKPNAITRRFPRLLRWYNRTFTTERSYDKPYNSDFAVATRVEMVKSIFKASDKDSEVTYTSHDNTTGNNLQYTT